MRRSGRWVAVAAAALLFVGGSGAAGQEADTPRVQSLKLRVVDLVLRTEGIADRRTDTGPQVQIDLVTDVLFAFNRADLGSEAQAVLQQAATIIGNEAAGPVRIDGYTDSVGDDAYNLDLSRRRAEAVRAGLAGLPGAAGRPFVTSGFGEANPVAPNANPDGSDNPEGRARNRRVTISFQRRAAGGG